MAFVQDTTVTADQDSSVAGAASATPEARPALGKRVTEIALTAIVLAGIAALTLGWGALLVRGAIWLFLG